MSDFDLDTLPKFQNFSVHFLPTVPQSPLNELPKIHSQADQQHIQLIRDLLDFLRSAYLLQISIDHAQSIFKTSLYAHISSFCSQYTNTNLQILFGSYKPVLYECISALKRLGAFSLTAYLGLNLSILGIKIKCFDENKLPLPNNFLPNLQLLVQEFITPYFAFLQGSGSGQKKIHTRCIMQAQKITFDQDHERCFGQQQLIKVLERGLAPCIYLDYAAKLGFQTKNGNSARVKNCFEPLTFILIFQNSEDENFNIMKRANCTYQDYIQARSHKKLKQGKLSSVIGGALLTTASKLNSEIGNRIPQNLVYLTTFDVCSYLQRSIEGFNTCWIHFRSASSKIGITMSIFTTVCVSQGEAGKQSSPGAESRGIVWYLSQDPQLIKMNHHLKPGSVFKTDQYLLTRNIKYIRILQTSGDIITVPPGWLYWNTATAEAILFNWSICLKTAHQASALSDPTLKNCIASMKIPVANMYLQWLNIQNNGISREVRKKAAQVCFPIIFQEHRVLNEAIQQGIIVSQNSIGKCKLIDADCFCAICDQEFVNVCVQVANMEIDTATTGRSVERSTIEAELVLDQSSTTSVPENNQHDSSIISGIICIHCWRKKYPPSLNINQVGVGEHSWEILVKAEPFFYIFLQKIIANQIEPKLVSKCTADREVYLMRDYYIGETKSSIVQVPLSDASSEEGWDSESYERISKKLKEEIRAEEAEQPFMKYVDDLCSLFVKTVNRSQKPEDSDKEQLLKYLAEMMSPEERVATTKLVGKQFRFENLTQAALNILRPLRVSGLSSGRAHK